MTARGVAWERKRIDRQQAHHNARDHDPGDAILRCV
ncbi:hypothetical protein XaFJ1_GM002729 [Xanthomonas albilineans]|nr:hypothetical protein XaFJ1_GM002729 [Xanthomonas albilineans]